MAKTTTRTNKARTTDPAAPKSPRPVVPPPTLTPDLVRQLREAATLDDAMSLLVPTRKRSNDPSYRLIDDCPAPLPQRRGACLKVIAVAAQLNRVFKVADITSTLPDVRSAAYWTRRLATSGHLQEVEE